jgi:hypothetical protein
MAALGSAGNDDAEGTAPLVVFLHIPKTAGTTLGTLLRRHYGPAFRRIDTSGAHDPEVLRQRVETALSRPGLAATQGHITAGVLDLMPEGALVGTILRDPAERTLSQFHHLVTRVGRWQHDWLAPPSRDLTIAGCLGERSYIADNLQTRMLCGTTSPIEPLPADALDRAKQTLRDRFTFVGTTERFDEWLALLNLKLGWPTVAYEPARAAPERMRKGDVSPEDLRRIEEANALDQQLYEYGAQLLAQALEQAGPELLHELEILRIAQERLNGAGDSRSATASTRSFPAEARVELAVKEFQLLRAEAELKSLSREARKRERAERRVKQLKRELRRRTVKGRLARLKARIG